MVKNITFDCQGISLEGKLTTITPSKAAIITHPHPLYGGDMHNPVVKIIAQAYQNKGWNTLCFNFRGTDGSEGSFDNGIGEQQDVDAAIAYLTQAGIQEVELAGYSFGAYVLASRARKRIDRHPMRFIAPPVAFMDFNPINPLESLKQVVVGSNDEFAPLYQVESISRQWNSEAKFNVIDHTDHFYGNQLSKLQKVLESSIYP